MNPEPNPSSLPQFGVSQIELLERLCNACAVSGDEAEVRAIVLEQVRPYVEQVKVDPLGNIIAFQRGKDSGKKSEKDRLRVMLAAHMDEVGFMLVAEDGEGFYRFDTVGWIDERQLTGKPLWIGRAHVPGIIGVKPIHLSKPEELKNKLSLDTLRIDVGPAKGKVKIGDRATFATPFARMGNSVRAKSLDNRLGVATLIELVKYPYPNLDLYAVFTVQEEIGGQGARVSAYATDPQLAIAIDATPAYDLPSWDDTENTTYNTRLDAGPAIYLADSRTISDPRLVRHFVSVAEARNLPYQFRQPGGGGTDAGVIHKQRAGIPSISISVPGRYAHTAAGLARLSDWEQTLALLHAGLEDLSVSVFEENL